MLSRTSICYYLYELPLYLYVKLLFPGHSYIITNTCTYISNPLQSINISGVLFNFGIPGLRRALSIRVNDSLVALKGWAP